jgi:hypothetical protein
MKHGSVCCFRAYMSVYLKARSSMLMHLCTFAVSFVCDGCSTPAISFTSMYGVHPSLA